MKYKTDYASVAKIILVLIIGAVFFYNIFSMMKFGEGYAKKSVDGVRAVIDKALVQCYALEGSYPTDLKYVSRYGVIFDDSRYIYHYEWYGSNMRPNVIIIER
jgi:hypothetical protein